MRALLNAFEDFKSSLDSAVVLSLPALFGLVIALIFARPTYMALGGVFLRTSDLVEMDALPFILSLVAVIISIVLISLTYVLVSVLVKEKRLGVRFSERKVRSMIAKAIIPMSLILFFLFSLNFVLQSISLVVPYFQFIHVVSLLSYALLFFSPYALVIDEYRFWHALQKSIVLSFKAPFRFAFWLITLFVVIVVFHALSTALFEYTLSQYVTFLFSALIALPFSIILGAHLYMDRYPLS